MRAAMSRRRPDRIPTMPQFCHPHAVNVLCNDYRKGMADVIENPALADELLIEVARRYDVDGLRLFVNPEPLRVVDDGEIMIGVDPGTGERVC